MLKQTLGLSVLLLQEGKEFNRRCIDEFTCTIKADLSDVMGNEQMFEKSCVHFMLCLIRFFSYFTVPAITNEQRRSAFQN